MCKTMKSLRLYLIGIEQKYLRSMALSDLQLNYRNIFCVDLRKTYPQKYQKQKEHETGPKEKIQCHFTVKSLNIQNREGILRAAREKQVSDKREFIQSTGDISMKCMSVRGVWSKVFQI